MNNLIWYDISVKPEAAFKIELKKIWEENFPKHGKPWVEGKLDDIVNTEFTLLAVFDDINDGQVCDQEVSTVGYTNGNWYRNDGTWTIELCEESVSTISSWCFMPDAPDEVITNLK